MDTYKKWILPTCYPACTNSAVTQTTTAAEMKPFAALGFCLVLFTLAACAPQPYVLHTPFDESAFAPYAEKGKAKVYGQAFLVTNGGDVKKGAGKKLVLMPDNPYTEEFLQVGDSNKKPISDPRFGTYIKVAVADADGNFEFDGLPSGDYVLLTEIRWMVPSDSIIPQYSGSELIKRFSLQRGEHQKVLLTSE